MREKSVLALQISLNKILWSTTLSFLSFIKIVDQKIIQKKFVSCRSHQLMAPSFFSFVRQLMRSNRKGQTQSSYIFLNYFLLNSWSGLIKDKEQIKGT